MERAGRRKGYEKIEIMERKGRVMEKAGEGKFSRRGEFASLTLGRYRRPCTSDLRALAKQLASSTAIV